MRSDPKAGLRRTWNFIGFTAERFVEDRCTQVAASLTFTTLLSLVPLVTIAITLFAAFPAFSGFLNHIKVFLLTNMVPEAAGKLITVYMQQFADNAGRLTALGLIFLGVAAMLLIQTIETAFNAIWRVDQKRPVAQRIITYWAVLTLGPLLIGASLSLTSWVVSASLGLVSELPAVSVPLLWVVPVLLMTLAFTLIFHTVPNCAVQRRHALAGGVTAALLLDSMNRGFGLYIKLFATYNLVYGAFAAIPIFLLWVYLSWTAVLLAAEIAAALPLWRTSAMRRRRAAGSRFSQAMAVLRVLTRAQHAGNIPRVQDLRPEAPDGVDGLLATLERAGWARRVAGDGWVLVRDAAQLKVADVYRLFVFDPGKEPMADIRVGRMMEAAAAQLESRLDTSLHELFVTHAGAADAPASPPPA